MPCLASAKTDGWDNPIVTDRPDVTESSQTVGKWRFQLELGTLVGTGKNGGTRETFVSTPIKVRFGHLRSPRDPSRDPRVRLELAIRRRRSLLEHHRGAQPLLRLQTALLRPGHLAPLGGPAGVRYRAAGYRRLGQVFLGYPADPAADWQIGSAWGVGTNLGTLRSLFRAG